MPQAAPGTLCGGPENRPAPEPGPHPLPHWPPRTAPQPGGGKSGRSPVPRDARGVDRAGRRLGHVPGPGPARRGHPSRGAGCTGARPPPTTSALPGSGARATGRGASSATDPQPGRRPAACRPPARAAAPRLRLRFRAPGAPARRPSAPPRRCGSPGRGLCPLGTASRCQGPGRVRGARVPAAQDARSSGLSGQPGTGRGQGAGRGRGGGPGEPLHAPPLLAEPVTPPAPQLYKCAQLTGKSQSATAHL